MQPVARKVPSACQRCRKQKLKCDVQRPCTMCVRANAECHALQSTRWKVETGVSKRDSDRIRTDSANTTNLRPTKRQRVSGTDADAEDRSDNTTNAPDGQAHVSHGPQSATTSPSSLSATRWNSSSTLVLVEEAFHHHRASTPEESEISAFSASQWTRPRPISNDNKRGRSHFDPLQRLLSRHVKSSSAHVERPKVPSPAEAELLSLLPGIECASLLIENYFDRIHWFMLLFHQQEFRDNFERLYSPQKQQSSAKSNGNSFGYIAVFLAVCAISLQYTRESQKRTLVVQGIDPEALKEKILLTLRLRLLDVLSLGSLEAVQMCVLLGSYYLYHGQPELAWPLCGCGLRIAQALNLHRKVPLHDANHEGYKRPIIAARQRCWWAVYEIETFCSMMYGFPLSITDSDCDVEELDLHDECSASTTCGQSSDEPNLLFFKGAMSKLSKIVKSALTDLYGTHPGMDRQDRPLAGYMSRLQTLIKKVSDLDSKLLKWLQSLPEKLRSVDVGDGRIGQISTSKNAGSGQDDSAMFRERLFQLQALVLKLAYENARILVHRPLLSYKMVPSEGDPHEPSGTRSDPFLHSINTCRHAALQISKVGSTAIFTHVSDTYAVTFVSLHLFTAGVTLCIMASLDPLSRESHESKMGIRGLMEMQTILKPKSMAASQGLDILRNLMSLVMAKEINNMFELKPPAVGEFEVVGDSSGSSPRTRELDLDQPNQEPPLSRSAMGSPTMQLQQNSIAPAAYNCEELLAVPPSSLDFDFCENPSMAEALLDFEQAISYPPSDVAEEYDSPTLVSDQISRNSFVGQDQGWIWGWNYNI